MGQVTCFSSDHICLQSCAAVAVRHLPLVPVLGWDKEVGPLKNQNLPAREQVLALPHKYLPRFSVTSCSKGQGQCPNWPLVLTMAPGPGPVPITA